MSHSLTFLRKNKKRFEEKCHDLLNNGLNLLIDRLALLNDGLALIMHFDSFKVILSDFKLFLVVLSYLSNFESFKSF